VFLCLAYDAFLAFTLMHMRSLPSRKSLAFALLFCVAAIPTIITSQDAHAHHWAYEGKEGPAEWGKIDNTFAACSTGHAQSPIDIKGATAADLPALKFDYKAAPLNIIDNGHTIQINYPAGSKLTVGDKTYALQQIHFHHPSEEQINGHASDMVAHFVHSDSDGHLAVVAVLLKQGTENPQLATVWRNIPSQKEKAVAVPGAQVNVANLLPADHGYYTFAGSLTTPPCSEGVTWFVLKQPTSISANEIAVFAKLYPKNARPTQPLNNRKILETK
jgi:carbonic anhydrase